MEERRFSAALASKKESRAVSPVASDADVFHTLAKAGKHLAEIHVHYEQQPEYKLTKTEKKGEKLDYSVKKMKLSKDKTTLIYNQFLTLSGIPKATYDYRLGNRSALEWVIDQYQVSSSFRLTASRVGMTKLSGWCGVRGPNAALKRHSSRVLLMLFHSHSAIGLRPMDSRGRLSPHKPSTKGKASYNRVSVLGGARLPDTLNALHCCGGG